MTFESKASATRPSLCEARLDFRGRRDRSKNIQPVLRLSNTEASNGHSDILRGGKGVVSVLFLEETHIFPLHERYRSLCRPSAICAIFRSPFPGAGTGRAV